MIFCPCSFRAILSSFRANTCHDTILQHTSFHLKRFAGSSFISFLMSLPGLANLWSILPINSGLHHTGTFDKGLTALEGCVGPKKTFLREKKSKIASFGTVFNLFPLFAQMSLFFHFIFLTFQTTALSASTFQHNMYCPLLLLAKWSPLD